MCLPPLFQASNIDDVLAHHNDFLDKCLKDCMLTTPQLLKIVSKLMLVCVTFSNFIQVSFIILVSFSFICQGLSSLFLCRLSCVYLGLHLKVSMQGSNSICHEFDMFD